MPLPREAENVLRGEKLLRKERQSHSYGKLHSWVLGAISWCQRQVQQRDETKADLVRSGLALLCGRVVCTPWLAKDLKLWSEQMSPCHQSLYRQTVNPGQRSSPQITVGILERSYEHSLCTDLLMQGCAQETRSISHTVNPKAQVSPSSHR